VLDMAYDPPDRNPGKPWKWIIIDSLIVACIVFISVLPSDRLPTLIDLYIALRGFIYAFLIQVAVERGLKPFIVRRNQNRNENENG